MKRLTKAFISIVAAALLGFALFGCGSSDPAPATSNDGDTPTVQEEERTTIRIGAAQVPHAEILELIKPTLAEQGVDLEIIIPTDETLLVQLTADGELDANYVGHWPAISSEIAEKGLDLVNIGGIHVEPIGAYSTKYTLEDLPEDALIAIPNNSTNELRALNILEQNGFIKLKADVNPVTVTINDVETYLKPITLIELEAGLIVRSGDQFDAYITNTNRILEAGIDPNTNLFREEADSPYSNVLCVRSEDANNPAILKLYDALRTEEVREFILDKYQGAVIPSF